MLLVLEIKNSFNLFLKLLVINYLASSNFSQVACARGKSGAMLSAEHRLFKKLMKNYEKSIRPVQNSSQAVVIKLGITLTQIFDLDERNQVLTVSVWLDQEWKDDNFRWNPEYYGGIEKVQLPCDLLWLPDIVLYNSVDDYTEQYMRSLAMVFPDGTVFWPPIVRFRSSCKVDITYFPFDDQICHMKMGSWAYDGFQVDVTNRSAEVDLTNYVNNGEWELVELRTIRNIHHYSCCPEPFPDVTFWFHLRRRTTYYTFNIIIPCIILSLLTMASFLLPPASGEKISLGLTVLLAFSVFMLLIAETMPATSEFVPLIGLYLTVIMAMTSLSVVFSVFVLYIHHKGSRGVRAPLWARKICFRFIARLLCMQSGSATLGAGITDRPFAPASVRSTNSNSFHKSSANRGNLYANMVHTANRFQSVENIYVKENGQVSLPPYDVNYVRGSGKPESNSAIIKAKWLNAQDEILNHLRTIVNRQKKEDKDTQIVREWQDIGFLIDRLLLILFTSITTFSTIGLLLIQPMHKDMNLSEFIQKFAP